MTLLRSSYVARGLACVGLFAVIGACGDDETTNPTEELLFESFPEAFREAQCAHAVACSFMPEVQTCRGALDQDRWLIDSVAAAAYGTIAYDPAAARACVDALTNASCESVFLMSRDIREACDPVFTGRGANGDPCVSSAECQGVDAACEGSCGENCCAGTCVVAGAKGEEGEPCSDTNPCGPANFCRYIQEANESQCVKRAGANETCVAGGCIDGYACDSATSKCFKQATTGAQCNPNLNNACAHLGEYCSAETTTCVALPAAGQPCAVNGVSDQHCARYSVCVDGTCQKRPSAGAACLFSSVCLGDLDCSGDPDNVCEPLRSPRACVSD